jgi:hypothetical protein
MTCPVRFVYVYYYKSSKTNSVYYVVTVCFDYFRVRCDLHASIEENKAVLKEKMKEAQTAGERANQSRYYIVAK